MKKKDATTIIQELEKTIIYLDDNIDQVAREFQSNSPNPRIASLCASHSISLTSSAINRYTPVHSPYRENFSKLIDQHPLIEFSNLVSISWALKGLLQALLTDYKNGYLESVEELLNAELFSDFMGMALHLLEEGYYIPAAVLIGSVLEENIRKLSIANDLSIEKEDGSALKASVMNDNLKKADVYNGIVQKQVTAWLGIRNSAAHGKYDEFTKEHVLLMHQGVLGFIQNNPA